MGKQITFTCYISLFTTARPKKSYLSSGKSPWRSNKVEALAPSAPLRVYQKCFNDKDHVNWLKINTQLFTFLRILGHAGSVWTYLHLCPEMQAVTKMADLTKFLTNYPATPGIFVLIGLKLLPICLLVCVFWFVYSTAICNHRGTCVLECPKLYLVPLTICSYMFNFTTRYSFNQWTFSLRDTVYTVKSHL